MWTALRKGWWLSAAGLIIGGLVGMAIVLVSRPMYTSNTQFFVSTTNASSPLDVYQGSQFSEQRVVSYSLLLSGPEMATRVIDRLGLQLTPAELSKEISASSTTNTVLIDVSVTDRSPVQAQRIASAIDAEFPQLVNQLETPTDAGASPVKITVTERPNVPGSPSSPKKVLDIALGLVLGLLVGGIFGVLRARLDRTIKDPRQASSSAGVSVIGSIIQDPSLADGHVIETGHASRVAEDYRQLRANLQFLDVDNPPKVILVSSAMPAEGKTTVAINLALALSEVGRQVVIVETDLRRPRVTRYLGMVGGVGLTNVLAGTAEVGEVIQAYRENSFSVVGAGPTPPNPGQLLASGQMAALINELREKNDYVLIDAPPLLPVADSTGLAVVADGVLISVRYGRSRKDQLRRAAETLDRVGARTLGLILNIVPPKAEIAGAYGYGYTYDSNVDGGRGSHRRNE